jgi:antitoxin ParD1/3/4
METAEKLSITMTPAMLRAVRASVEAGEYASTSEAVRDAIRLWQRDRDEHAERLSAIRERVRHSVEDGRAPLGLEEVRNRLAALHETTVKAHGRGAT